MKVVPNKDITYETMPEFDEEVPGAQTLIMTGEEIGVEYIPDVIYDETHQLRLQILQPSIFNDPDHLFPGVVFVQGSAWREQKIYRNVANLGKLASRGYVCAIVEYRHSGIAHFPAPIIDAKNAIRYMQKHHELYHVDVDRMIVMGDSSGGEVSCLVGMTSRTDLYDEGDSPLNLKGFIDLYGAVDVTLPYGFPSTEDHQRVTSPEGMFMGFDIDENIPEALKACAKTYADYDYPPALILHGTKDHVVNCEESVQLYQAMREAGKDVTLYLVKASDHGGAAFWTEEALDIYDRFMKKCFQ